MRDNADHEHGTHDHAFGVGAAHEAGHPADLAAAESISGGLHQSLTEHVTVTEGHAGAVLLPHDPAAATHAAVEAALHDHVAVDDHGHLGGGAGHFGLGIEHDHADGLSGLHDSIHDGGLGFHGDEHHGLGEGLAAAHDHPDDHGHGHGLGDIFHH
jgi:hypothetical protein